MLRARTHLCSILVLAAILSAFCDASALAPPEVRYNIHVTLDVANRRLIGHETIAYTSGAETPLNEIYLHAYPNALLHRHSTMGQEMEDVYRDFTLAHLKPQELGRLDITSLAVNGLASQYDVHDTSIRIKLARPLAPHDSLRLNVSFVTMIPSLPGRFRTEGRNFSVAQWYPKIAVFDQTGWHHDSYHLLGEFYGEFATYDVSITLPQEYYVGATGTFISGDDGDNDMPKLAQGKPSAEAFHARRLAEIKSHLIPSIKTLHFHAEHVHDFAWVCSPDYVVDETEWHGVKILALVLRDHIDSKWKNLLSYEINALRFFTEQVGKYPYLSLTAAEALNFPAGAMEYPQLVMLDPGLNIPATHALEYVTVHEIGHNWFYGAIANNELDDPWLDEGFEEYFTQLYAERTYPNGSVFDAPAWMSRFLNLPYRWTHEINYRLLQAAGRDLPIAQSAYRFADEREYEAIVYSKGSLVLDRLHDAVGDSLFTQIMKTYYSEFRFRHVTIPDFIRVASHLSGRDLSIFFDQSLNKPDSFRNIRAGAAPPIRFAQPLSACAFVDPNHYVVALEPTLWYNEVDRLRIGASLKSSYLLTYHALSAGISYGTGSGTTGYHVNYSTPVITMPDIRFAMRATNDLGTRAFSVELGNEQPFNLFLAVFGAEGRKFPMLNSSLSFQYRDRYDSAYLDPKFYALGKTAVVRLAGTAAQQGYEGITRVDFSVGQGLYAFGARSAFTRGFVSIAQDLRFVRTGEVVMTLRGAAGAVSRNAPTQEQLAIGFGVPTSSVDPIGQLIINGGGGVRGYQYDAVLGQRLLAASVEISSERYGAVLPYIEPRLFMDLGRVSSQSSSRLTNRTLYDAGFELRVFSALQLSFPIWLSSPEAGRSQFDLRVVARIVMPTL